MVTHFDPDVHRLSLCFRRLLQFGHRLLTPVQFDRLYTKHHLSFPAPLVLQLEGMLLLWYLLLGLLGDHASWRLRLCF